MVTGHYLVDVIENNKLLLGLAVTAGIVTMPEPGTEISWRSLYRWIFDWAHQFLNMKRPTLPGRDSPAQTKQ